VAAQVLKITSKRQATFPSRVCKELGVKAGQEIVLEKKEVEGEAAWVLRPKRSDNQAWYGSLRKYAKGKQHDMADIRASIGRNHEI
jgi:bifunctional DNA-binding transcriptional regulator/antitoxin component of YhaV-PrlF toxin-antitoxin module